MKTTPTIQTRRLGLRVISRARALLAVSALAALAVSTARADVVFTRSTATGEHWGHYTATFTPAYSGNYTLGFNVTAGGSSGDNSIIIDAVKVTSGVTTLFTDGFESPGLSTNTGVSANGGTATFGSWVFSNYSGILNGSPSSWDLAGAASMPSGSPFTLGSADGTSQYAYLQAAGGTLPKMKAASTLALVGGQTYTISFYQASRYSFGGQTTYTVTLDAPVPVVFASGISGVTTWDPIFPPAYINPDSAESKPVPTVGYSANWVNPHAASVFPKNSHPWEYQSWVPAAFKFDANWINAWPTLGSGDMGGPGQSWTKYSTTVIGTGDYVLQFLADNASWIYIDGTLVGYQDYWWATNGSGRYTIQLSGASTHELSFVIWDGGGLAGGKFRLETKASFLANNPGATLPPAPATVTLSNLTQTYDGTPKSVTVTTAPSGLTTSVTYNGSTTAPTAAGSYSVVATVTDPNYLGSATGTLTINKAPVTFTLGNLAQTYDGTVKSITVSSTPSGVASVINYLGDRTNAGNCPVQVVSNNPNYTGTASDTLVIAKANATVSVSGYTGTYDAAAHGATGTATGVGGANLSAGLNLGASFTNAPGGTASWTFNGGTNYNNASGSVAIVINKADATIAVNGYTGTYDAAAHGATGSAKGVGGVTLPGLNLGASFTDAPGGTASWSFAGGTNYNDASGSAAIVIAKANATIVVNGYTGIYDTAAHGATGSATGVGGVDLSSGLTLGASFTDAPGGTANWSFAGGINYNDASGTAAIVINKADATITVGGYTGIYDAAAHGATGTATGVGGVDLSSGLTLGASFTDAPGGTANWSFAGGTNYNDASGTAAIVINKADATITVGGYTGIYDAAAHGATGAATGVGGVSLPGLNLGATFTNVPGGTASWSFAGGTNYNDASGSVAIVINKATANVTVAGYTGFYDDAAHGATGAATGVGGVSLPGLNLGASFTSVPGGTASWSFAGGTNYNDASGSVAIVINKATASVTVSGYTGIYDGLPHGATGSATGVGGVDLSAGLNLGGTFTNVSGGTANWSFAGGTNYNDASGSVAITINKANATVVVTPYTVEYDGLSHSATVTSITGVNGESGATVGGVTLNSTHTSVGTYADSWSFAGANYNSLAGSITDTIKDTTPPVITSLSSNAPTLWPPNHKMVAVTVSATATDLVGVTSLKIISVTSNEPDNGSGDGDTANDIQVTGALSVNLRAERSGHGNGRIYTITVQAMDAAGNASTQTITVVVPHEQGGDQDDDHGGKDNEGGKGGNDDHGKKGGNDDHGAKSAKDNKGGKGK